MQKLMTIGDIARHYDTSRQCIHQLAKRLGIKGRRIGTTVVVFTPSQVAKLKPGPRGRPRKDKKP